MPLCTYYYALSHHYCTTLHYNPIQSTAIVAVSVSTELGTTRHTYYRTHSLTHCVLHFNRRLDAQHWYSSYHHSYYCDHYLFTATIHSLSLHHSTPVPPGPPSLCSVLHSCCRSSLCFRAPVSCCVIRADFPCPCRPSVHHCPTCRRCVYVSSVRALYVPAKHCCSPPSPVRGERCPAVDL